MVLPPSPAKCQGKPTVTLALRKSLLRHHPPSPSSPSWLRKPMPKWLQTDRRSACAASPGGLQHPLHADGPCWETTQDCRGVHHCKRADGSHIPMIVGDCPVPAAITNNEQNILNYRLTHYKLNDWPLSPLLIIIKPLGAFSIHIQPSIKHESSMNQPQMHH